MAILAISHSSRTAPEDLDFKTARRFLKKIRDDYPSSITYADDLNRNFKMHQSRNAFLPVKLFYRTIIKIENLGWRIKWELESLRNKIYSRDKEENIK